MHTTVVVSIDDAWKTGEKIDIRIHHNSDWSGEAILSWSEEGNLHADVRIPGWVAEKLAQSREPT